MIPVLQTRTLCSENLMSVPSVRQPVSDMVICGFVIYFDQKCSHYLMQAFASIFFFKKGMILIFRLESSQFCQTSRLDHCNPNFRRDPLKESFR